MSVDIVGSFRLRLHLRFVVVFVVRFVRYRFKTKRNVSLFIAQQLKIGLKFSKKKTQMQLQLLSQSPSTSQLQLKSHKSQIININFSLAVRVCACL